MPMQITVITDTSRTTTTADEKSLLLTALTQWFDEIFSDEQVAEVKGIFKRVFQVEEQLQGSLFKDALVLQPVNDDTLHYAMTVLEEGEGEPTLAWASAMIAPATFQVLAPSLITFQEFLMIAGSSKTQIIMEEEALFIRDFFLFWKRKYSPTRIARVGVKGSPARRHTSAPLDSLPRTGETLARMKKEMLLLGFEDYMDDSYSRISGIWVDEDKEERGYAPQAFTISLADGADDKDDDSTFKIDYALWANDAWACKQTPSIELYADICQEKQQKYGVFINEIHGQSALLIKRWEEWDEWLEECMKPW